MSFSSNFLLRPIAKPGLVLYLSNKYDIFTKEDMGIKLSRTSQRPEVTFTIPKDAQEEYLVKIQEILDLKILVDKDPEVAGRFLKKKEVPAEYKPFVNKPVDDMTFGELQTTATKLGIEFDRLDNKRDLKFKINKFLSKVEIKQVKQRAIRKK
jgi:hypothetical protein